VQTLRIILSRDILRFMIIFLVSLGIFSGAFYLSLRYDDTLVTPPGSNTTSPGGGVNSDLRKLDGEGTLLYEVYFTGLRSLIEADSVLNYYGPGGSLRYMHWETCMCKGMTLSSERLFSIKCGATIGNNVFGVHVRMYCSTCSSTSGFQSSHGHTTHDIWNTFCISCPHL